MPLAPQDARKVREDATIERPAKKISMVDGYAESAPAAPDDVIITPPPATEPPSEDKSPEEQASEPENKEE